MINRVEKLGRKMIGRSPEFCMRMLMEKLDIVDIVPQPDKYYVFVYKAKTPKIKYDQHPFIICITVYPWGFVGFNYHWNLYRRYTWREVLTNLHEVYPEEVETVMNFPTAKFKMS